uniref:Uncharacterized protein n=1 Tax=Anguilla anguilla TaxID=7936 RepID=A0A0E9R5Y1_ANGAN
MANSCKGPPPRTSPLSFGQLWEALFAAVKNMSIMGGSISFSCSQFSKLLKFINYNNNKKSYNIMDSEFQIISSIGLI